MAHWIDANKIVHWQSYDDEYEEFPQHTGTIAELLDMMTDEGCPEPSDVIPRKRGVSELLPSVNVIEVVRCKDCEWWTKQDKSLQGRCARYGTYPTGEWFCAAGRKDGKVNGNEQTKKIE